MFNSIFFRGQLEIEEKTSDAKLRIEDIRTSDEGEYKCEITFLDITKNCPVVQLVKLTTLGAFHFVSFSCLKAEFNDLRHGKIFDIS